MRKYSSPLKITSPPPSFRLLARGLLTCGQVRAFPMKRNPLALLRPSLVRAAFFAALGMGATQSALGVVINFSGGAGAPLTITLTSPVSYTAFLPSTGPKFIFEGVGSLFPVLESTFFFSTITFSVNGGAPNPVNRVWPNAFGINDIGIDTRTATPTTAFAGDTIVLSAGTMTTNTVYVGVVPASGDFQTFLTDGLFRRSSNPGTPVGTSVPDSGSSVALLGLGLLGVCSVARISRRV